MSGRGKKAPAPKKKANGYKMPAPIPVGEVITDNIMKKKWRIGPSIGVGGFGEIYSACEHDNSPKNSSNYPFVIKIEPHENGPLFVEKNFYMRNANKDDILKFMKLKKLTSLGMPTFFGNGSHEFKGEKYRYLVLERYGKDLWNIFKDCGRVFPPTTVFQLGLQVLDVLEYIHSRGYVHADIKGANILLGLKKGTENQSYLMDFGLVTRLSEKEFKPDPKCAHNGTIEYTSRDAHLGVPTMRGDLEILGFNMLQWIVGELPWEKSLKQPKAVQEMKETFMKQVRKNISSKYKNVPDALIQFFEYINTLKPKDTPNYVKCQQLFESYLKSNGVNRNSKLDFSPTKKTKVSKANDNSQESLELEDEIDEEVPARKRKSPQKKKVVRKVVKKVENEESGDESDCYNENEEPNKSTEKAKKTVRRKKVVKRKSTEPAIVSKIKRTKLTPKATPPAKRNHANIATQTSTEKRKNVSFDSPIAEIIGQRRALKLSKDNESVSANSSGDIFEDSFVIKEKKVKGKLLSDEEITVKKVVKKRVTKTSKAKSWKNIPTVVNGRSPPMSKV